MDIGVETVLLMDDEKSVNRGRPGLMIALWRSSGLRSVRGNVILETDPGEEERSGGWEKESRDGEDDGG